MARHLAMDVAECLAGYGWSCLGQLTKPLFLIPIDLVQQFHFRIYMGYHTTEKVGIIEEMG